MTVWQNEQQIRGWSEATLQSWFERDIFPKSESYGKIRGNLWKPNGDCQTILDPRDDYKESEPSFHFSYTTGRFNRFGMSGGGVLTLARECSVQPPPYDAGNLDFLPSIRKESPEGKAAREKECQKRGAEAAEKREQEAVVYVELLAKARRYVLSLPKETGDHPYLLRKGVSLPEGHRIKRDQKTGNLVMPVLDATGQVISYQYVLPEKPQKGPDKFFATGLQSGGGYCPFGQDAGDNLLILGEGIATVLDPFSASPGSCTRVCFSASNLPKVAEQVKNRKGPIVVLADIEPRGVGLKNAKEAAEICGGILAVPPGDDEKRDWNDAFQKIPEEARKVWSEILEKAPKAKTSLLYEVKNKAFQGDIRRSLSRHDLWNGTFGDAKWVVEGLIPQAGLTVLAAPPKKGKSWFALQLGIAVESGVPFLGLRTTKGKVVYYALEDTERRLVERVHGLHPQGRPVGLPHCELTIPRLDQGGLEALVSMIEEENPSLVILDTWSKIKGSPERGLNAYEADYRLVAPLKAIAEITGVAILLITHLNKYHRGLDDIESITGSMGLPGAADAILFLKRDQYEDSANLARDGRDFSDSEPLVLKWDSPGWRIAEQNEQRDVVMESLTEFQTVILGVLEEYDGLEGMNPKEVSDYLTQGEEEPEKKQKHLAKVRLDISRMVKKGVLIKASRGKYLPSVVEREEKRDMDDMFDMRDMDDMDDIFPESYQTYHGTYQEAPEIDIFVSPCNDRDKGPFESKHIKHINHIIDMPPAEDISSSNPKIQSWYSSLSENDREAIRARGEKLLAFPGISSEDRARVQRQIIEVAYDDSQEAGVPPSELSIIVRDDDPEEDEPEPESGSSSSNPEASPPEERPRMALDYPDSIRRLKPSLKAYFLDRERWHGENGVPPDEARARAEKETLARAEGAA